MASNKKKKPVRRKYNPMAEVIRINKVLSEINASGEIQSVVESVNKATSELVDNNGFTVAAQILENRTIIKDFSNSDISIERYTESGKVQVVDKPLVIGYLRDYSGCGHFRMIYPMNMINTKFSYSGKINCTLFPVMLTQEDVVPHVRAFVFQRPIGDDQVHKIDTYKKFQKEYQYKLVGELDDYVFDLPEYHPGYDTSYVRDTRTLLHNLNKMDEVIVSTVNLKNELARLGVTTKITVIENCLPKHLYETDVKRFKISQRDTKPTIAFTGSNFHYNNEKQLDGDFAGNIKDFILKNLDNYKFMFFGDAPYFLKTEEISAKILIVPPTNPVEYATNLKKYRTDFVIGPLSENVFNACKSDLRYLEASAMGSIFIGSKFLGEFTSPYQNCRNTFTVNDSVEDIEAIIAKYSDVNLFNDEIALQYEELEGRWLEKAENLMKYVEVFSTGIGGVHIEQSHPQYESFKDFVK